MSTSPPPVLVASRGRQYRLSPTADTLIGSRGCATILNDPGVAPQHACISPSGGRFVIEDLAGGTRVNGATIVGPVVLQSGDVITVGRTNLVFHDPGAPVAGSTGQPLRPAPPKPGRARPTSGVSPSPVVPPAKLPPSSSPPPLPSASVVARMRGEHTLWKGRPSFRLSPFAWLTMRYKLTTERLLVTGGLLTQSLEEVELIRVKDVRLETGILQRIFSLGTITIFTVDQTAPELQLKNIPQADRVREAIRNAVRDERQKQGVHFAELMT